MVSTVTIVLDLEIQSHLRRATYAPLKAQERRPPCNPCVAIKVSIVGHVK
jgi:hypothetical protein